MIMLGGRLLREGVLQQSALSVADSYSPPSKSAALIDMVLAVVDLCDRLIDSGVPASVIEEFDFSPVVRAREESGPDDADGIRRLGEQVLGRLEGMS
jgi:V/A-type H+-transporting ATPase subunit A